MHSYGLLSRAWAFSAVVDFATCSVEATSVGNVSSIQLLNKVAAVQKAVVFIDIFFIFTSFSN